VTRKAIFKMINHYSSHEAGVRNLRKCLDRIFRKIVSKLEFKKADEEAKTTINTQEDHAEAATISEESVET